MNKFYQIIKIFQGGAVRVISDTLSRLDNRKDGQVIFSFPTTGSHDQNFYFQQPVCNVLNLSSQLHYVIPITITIDKDIAHPI